MKSQFVCDHKDKMLFRDGCATCHHLNRRPRTTMKLSDAMRWAEEKTADGHTVHLRDAKTGAVMTFSKFSKYSPEAYELTEDRDVYVCAVR